MGKGLCEAIENNVDAFAGNKDVWFYHFVSKKGTMIATSYVFV